MNRMVSIPGKLVIVIAMLLPVGLIAQKRITTATPATSSYTDYWQQKVKYVMDVDVNANANKFTGKQKLEYWNNSPDTLTKVFYHLYWNAFQPGSLMDLRSLRQGTIPSPRGVDWDNRVRDRISKLTPEEIGYQKVLSVKMNGKTQQFTTNETILEVKLDKPILPRSKAVFDMEFEAQVPIQIRRSGRDNAEGVRFSMSQWYPKMCEYDREGWHPTPYIAREFYGVWGDYEVKINIDKSFVLAATGYLQNANQVGYGYEATGAKVTRPAGDKLLWHFVAPNVHDFVWAADPDYIHESKKVRDDLTLHAFYKIVPEKLKNLYETQSAAVKAQMKNNPDNYVKHYENEWKEVLEIAELALPYIEKTFGAYPWKQYSFIQGGDGGMEYPMATLLKGAGPTVVVHEWMHSWYQGMMANNESMYGWMDEGFATYAESRVLHYLTRDTAFAYAGDYKAYLTLVKSDKEEPLTTHADHFNTNFAYTNGSYVKGGVFLEQLGYIIGADVRDKVLLEYYRQWRFKHPNPTDFVHVAEKVSGIKLDWYQEYWITSTKTIDYAIDSLWEEGGKTKIRIRNRGTMPMPIDLNIAFKDGTSEIHYVPLDLMFGEKPAESNVTRKVYPAWKWPASTYIIESNRKFTDIAVAEVDGSLRLADVERNNNRLRLVNLPGPGVQVN